MSRSAYETSFQTCPIILVGGSVGMMPIVNLLSSNKYPLGLTSTADAIDNIDNPANFFGQFRVMPGHSLMENEVATYPVANQTVAANAVITDPLRVSLEMIVPAGGQISFSDKLGIMTSLKGALDKHTAEGGWYNVSTPSYIYQGCLLTSLTDATDEEEGGQVQVRWIWSFMQPLLTVAAAQAAQNQAMAKISAQTQNAGDPPGSKPIQSNISSPSSNIVQNTVPSATNPVGSNVAPSTSTTVSTNLNTVSPVTPGG